MASPQTPLERLLAAESFCPFVTDSPDYAGFTIRSLRENEWKDVMIGDDVGTDTKEKATFGRRLVCAALGDERGKRVIPYDQVERTKDIPVTVLLEIQKQAMERNGDRIAAREEEKKSSVNQTPSDGSTSPTPKVAESLNSLRG